MLCLQTILSVFAFQLPFGFFPAWLQSLLYIKVSTNLFLDPNREGFYTSKVNIFKQILGLLLILLITTIFVVVICTEIVEILTRLWNPVVYTRAPCCLNMKLKDKIEGKKITKDKTGTAL